MTMKKRGSKKPLFKKGKGKKITCSSPCSCGGGVYFLALIGALVYHIQQATSFWGGVLGVLKALVWPAIIIYKLLGFL